MATRKKPKLSLNTKIFIAIVIILAAAIILGGMPQTAQFAKAKFYPAAKPIGEQQRVYVPQKALVSVPVAPTVSSMPTPTTKPLQSVFTVKLTPLPPQAITVTVCKSGPPACNAATIQQGVSITPPDGTTLVIDNGTYDETINIDNEKTTLDCNNATIIGTSAPGYRGIRIRANNVTVKNCAIKDTGIAVDGNFSNVVNNKIDISFSIRGLCGISYVFGFGNNNTIYNNRISSYNGICSGGYANTIKSNTISAYTSTPIGGSGILISSTGIENTITNNIVNGGLVGIFSNGGQGNKIVSNIVSSAIDGIDSARSNNDTVQNNKVSNVNNGISIEYATDAKVIQNNVLNATNNGIVSGLSSQGSSVAQNNVQKSGWGIIVADSGSLMENNTLMLNQGGLAISDGGTNARIKANTINSNNFGVVVFSTAGTGNNLNENSICSNTAPDIWCDINISGSNNRADNIQKCTGLTATKPCYTLPTPPRRIPTIS